MFGLLVISYLFLGGVGAGAIAVCSLADLFGLMRENHASLRKPRFLIEQTKELLDYGFLFGFIVLFVGVLSLLLDLGRLDRLLELFFSSSLSLVTIGAFALAALLALGAFLALRRFMYMPSINCPIIIVVEIITVAFSLIVMLYTGMLLQSLTGVAFWASPIMVVLFTLSSVSGGIALVLIASLFVEHNSTSKSFLCFLARIDIVLIVLEIVAVAAFIGSMELSTHPGVQEPLCTLVKGEVAPFWWIGFCACGLIVPLVFELILLRSANPPQMLFVAIAVLVLIGSFSLRFSIVEAGVHREIVLEVTTERSF